MQAHKINWMYKHIRPVYMKAWEERNHMVSCEDSYTICSYVIKPHLTTFICDGNVNVPIVNLLYNFGVKCID